MNFCETFDDTDLEAAVKGSMVGISGVSVEDGGELAW